jgi:hypothetical protein
VGAALKLSATADYQRLVTVITGGLDYWPVLDRTALCLLVGEAI